MRLITGCLVNRLKLNKGKTEVLAVISAKETTRSSINARSIGVIFDNHFHFNAHIASTCKSSFYHLRNISYIRKYL